MTVRRLLKELDWPLALTTLGLVLFGLVAVYSATYAFVPSDPFYYVKRQSLWIFVGLAAMCAVLAFDYRSLGRFARLIYLGSAFLLALVLVLAPTIMGAERWIVIGPAQVQPSEFAKVAIIVTLARHLSMKESVDRPVDLVSPLLHISLPMLLVMLQPDLGTALIFVGIVFGMLWVAGYPLKYLLLLALTGVALFVVAAVLSLQGWLPILKEYQLRRLLVFLDPYRDRTGAGWNVIQSMIAIGSGGFFGKGLFAGSQTQLDFLPSRHTDFIFSVIAEELGFLGAFLLFLLYLAFLWRALRISRTAKDKFGMLIVTGVVAMFFCHALINIGMTLGVMPVTGLPLPFISVGGSSLVASFLAVGLALNVHARRRAILFSGPNL